MQGEQATQENARLRDLLRYVDGPQFPGDYRPVNTRIISWSNEFDQQVMIAAGRDRGIREDTPIVTRDGFVGRVTQLIGNSAQVTLLTDENSAVQARDLTTGAFGLVRHGQGEGSLILETRSSKYPSLFPQGIQIGVVTSVGQSDTALYKQIQIEPFVDFSSLDAVTALIATKRSPRAP